MSPSSVFDRRRFLRSAATVSALAHPAIRAVAQSSSAPVTLTLHSDQPGPTLPPNYIGLSYEIEQLSDPSFFSASNTGLIEQFRALSPNGVFRLGGNTSDVGWWKPTPDSAHPPLPSNVVLQTPKGERSPMDLAYAVTPEAVRNLRAFLDATGWTCLYGINLGSSTPARAADEAEFVHKTLGAKLEYFQVGNEPDGFGNRFRDKATWNADAYFNDWLASANAIRERVPSARFGMPDVASRVAWFPTIADRLLALKERPDVVTLSHHYYFTGPPSNPKANINDLLHPDPKVTNNAAIAHDAAQKLGTHYRMTEGNSCYRGGKPGFSDVFAATLWSADYCLLLASLGYSGVNLHGGSAKQVANSLGGTLPGDALITDPERSPPSPLLHAHRGHRRQVFCRAHLLRPSLRRSLRWRHDASAHLQPRRRQRNRVRRQAPHRPDGRRHHQQGRRPAPAHRSRRLQRRPRSHRPVAHLAYRRGPRGRR